MLRLLKIIKELNTLIRYQKIQHFLILLLFNISLVNASDCTLFTKRIVGILSGVVETDSRVTKAVSKYGFGASLTYRAQGDNLRSLSGRDVRVLSYNMLNLEMTQGKWVFDEKLGKRVLDSNHPPQLKRMQDRIEQAQIFKEMDPDIAVVTEVEGLTPLLRFNDELLDGKYVPLIINGNDERGIQIAFLIKKDLAIDAQLHSFRFFSGRYYGKEMDIFSRDFPLLELFDKGALDTGVNPKVVVGGVHLKSQRDRGADIGSKWLRTEQVKAMMKIEKMVSKRYGEGVPFIMSGDFNNSLNPEDLADEFKVFSREGFRDVFDAGGDVDFGDRHSRATHTYHPRGGDSEANQMDGIFVRNSHRQHVKRSGIYRYKDAQGREIPIPKTYDQRKENPSDHFPVWADIYIP